MSKIPSPPSKWRVDLDVWEVVFCHSVPDMDFFAITSLILSHLELLRIELPKLTSSILIEILTIQVLLVDQFYFYVHQPIKVSFIFPFSYSFEITCIILWQVISLVKKMVVLSAKFAILILFVLLQSFYQH